MHFCPPFLLCLVTQSCLTLCDPMDCSLPGSSIPGILQARILKWIAMPSSSGSSQPRDRTQVFYIAGRFFTIWATREAHFSTRCLCILVIIKVSVQQFQYLWAWIFISLFCILIIYWVSNSMCRMSVKMEENSFLVKRVCVCVCVHVCMCVCEEGSFRQSINNLHRVWDLHCCSCLQGFQAPCTELLLLPASVGTRSAGGFS